LVLDDLQGPRVSVAIVTGSGGLVGSQVARRFADLGLHVVGVDNDMRGQLFGPGGSVQGNLDRLSADLSGWYSHVPLDIRDRDRVEAMLNRYGADVSVVVHAAAQPSHDYADEDPLKDWDINAGGTVNLLNATRRHAPDAVFVYLSTIKVYGPHPNALPLHELGTRLDLRPGSSGWAGITEDMPIDGGPHSLFGAGKTAADVMVQEYGHAFGLRTVSLRPGCLTGPDHAGTEAHGFLSYLMRCVMEGRPYRIIGYGGKQVRDQLHAADVVAAIEAVFRDPPSPGDVFNLGGGRGTDVSVLEAVELAEQVVGRPAKVEHVAGRRGDHRWWITDTYKFGRRYGWAPTYDVPGILKEIHEANADRWRP